MEEKNQEIQEEEQPKFDYRKFLIEDFMNNNVLHLTNFSCISRFKSIRRAIRRGHVSLTGTLYPKRPFKNIKAKKGTETYNKKIIHEWLRTKDDKRGL